MAYRDDLEALHTKRASLERDLAEIEAKSREMGDLHLQAEAVRRKLAETRALLDSMATKRSLPILDTVRIASPCNASWEDMVGDERVRFCGGCAKNVYNLSAMPREEAEALLREKEDNLCARLYRRADGTVISSDCPVGVRKKRVRKIAIAAVGGGMLAAMAAAGALTSRATRTMGTVAYQGKVAAPMAETPGTVAPTAAPPVATGQPNVETPKHDAPAQHTMGRIRIERHDDQTPVPIRGTTRAR